MRNLSDIKVFYLSFQTREAIDKIMYFFVSLISLWGIIVSVLSFINSTQQLLPCFVLLTGISFIGISWILFWKARQYDKEKIISIIFFAALFVRIGIILCSPFTNQFVDLCMDQDMGQLIINNVNPYNFYDNVILRNQLRVDERAYTYFTGLNQENWNYHAGSQLPLLELMMGWIESLASHSFAYRAVFSWFDSLLCIYILLIANQKWKTPIHFSFFGKIFFKKRTPEQVLILYIVCVSVIAPILLRSGTLVASFKGSMTLFTLCAIFFSYQKSKQDYLFLSAFFLGFSTAFMAISVLALPLILHNLYYSENTNSKRISSLLAYTFISLLSCLVWFIPFYDTLFSMIQHRLEAGINMPIHGSIWRFVSLTLPQHWQLLKLWITILFVLINLFGFWKKQLSWEILTSSIFILFLHLLTIDGSMDRINISLMICIILFGISQRLVYHTLIPIYFWGGAILVLLSLILGISEKIFQRNFIEYSLLDGVFNSVFFVVYCFEITKLSIQRTQFSN